MKSIFYSLLLFLASCANQNYWNLDTIAASDRSFDSSKLLYVGQNPSSPLFFEMLRVGQNVEAFLALTQGRFAPSSNESNCVTAQIWIDGVEYREEIPLREGGMKVRLSLETTALITQALQRGKNVSILLDDNEQVLEPNLFSRTFSRFLGKRYKDENLFKGLIQ